VVTKSALTARQAYLPSFAMTRSARDSSGKPSLIGQNTHLSNDQRETGEQSVKRVAIVDDEEELCSLFSMLVKHMGYHGECVANDGDEIVQLVLGDNIHPDLILMDYRMPTMNGMQAAERILRVRPEMKIVIASADDSVRRDAIAAGLFFLQKPFSILALSKKIEEALGRS
jgi:CheY-like chemotaxis protein